MSTTPNRHHTRAATLAGIFPPPKLPRETPSTPSSPSEGRRTTGSRTSRPVTPELLYSDVVAAPLSRGVSPVAREGQGDVPGSARASTLSELPSLTRDVDFGSGRSQSPISTIMHGETMSVHSNDNNINHQLPPSESESVSTVSKAVQDMSHAELVSLARRFESMARDAMAEANRKLNVPSNIEPDSGLAHARESSSLSPAISAGEGPFRNKGKGPDPRNWGAAGFSPEFSERDIEAQRDAFNNFAEINHVVKQEKPIEFTPTSASAKPAKGTNTADTKIRSDVIGTGVPNAEIRPEVPENPHVPSEEPTVEIPRTLRVVSEPLSAGKGTNQSGQTHLERITELEDELSRLRQLAAAEPAQLLVSGKPSSKAKHAAARNIAGLIRSDAKRSSSMPIDSTPSRIAAGSFLDKAIRGAARLTNYPPPPEPSDSSSSSGSDEPSSPNADSLTDAGRRSSTSTRQRHLSSRGPRAKRMLLKPIPPSKYTGDPDANAFHRFVREGSAYVKMGRVPARDQVFYLSYFLENKARDFYNQVVVRDEDSYGLERFFVELFEFCFPVDFRSKQRKRLSRCTQGRTPVTAHVAEFSQIYNTIGLDEGQEKVVKLWNSLRTDIRQEMYRKDLDPEISTWDEVVRAAEHAEIVRNLESESEPSSEKDTIPSKSDHKHGSRPTTDRAGGRTDSKHRGVAMHTSSADLATSELKEKRRSAKRRNEMLAQGRCFTCEEPGHLARNCPTTTNVKSDVKGRPPGFGLHSVQLNAAESALFESTEVLDTLPIGALVFGSEPKSKLPRNAKEDAESVQECTSEAEIYDGCSTMNASNAEDQMDAQAGQHFHGSFSPRALKEIGDRSMQRSGGRM
ncbi:hypothetical protein B0H15DRAFT_958148 [Mycena belliarum]|uniref:CCHC-type domain-containing protein n=1 Tax=Mycena belliarum TaxID=1033014 RepID=A0AAD6TNG7_9AGAR|nr:hypothetical protein B0H15DRAFT_958148 [Mycena belliae]